MSDDVTLNIDFADTEPIKTESRFSVLKSRFGLKVAAASTGMAGLVSCVSADTSINWTSITDLLEGVTTIFPSIGNMVVAIIPTLMILAVVGFVLYFFDAILDAISGSLKIFRR
ncbi:hypothetical protein [Methanoplanus limicola]|uniref:Uncharacterized protein n=1 Tax=Methanoplanus limicola DSM 2279 TaxID=937775 RepID=H1Z2Q2_9EURY|nr:hypothetical protein [Methanoplanus limicola]EHQ36455.1 hypothetical protein Metlim_2405 [Methanoplanus limicola DSM 2279]